MSAAASPQMNETLSHRLLYRYLTDETLYKLLWRVVNSRLNDDIQVAITNSNNASLNGVTVHASVKVSSHGNDIYILIRIALHNRNIGHITLHLIPSDTRANTIGPLHIRNNTLHTRVSRIKVTLHENPSRLELSRGSAPNRHYSIGGNTVLSRTSDIIFGVLNSYLDPSSPASLTILSNQVNYTHSEIRELVRNITKPQNTRQREPRIRRTRFSNNHKIAGGGVAQRKTRRRRSVHRSNNSIHSRSV